MNKKLIHKVFDIGLILKSILAVVETVSGILLFFISSNLLLKLVYYLFGHELVQDPTDIIANLLINFFSGFSFSMRIFFAVYLLIHGLIKGFLIIELFREKLWAYPLSMAIFSLFLLYQVYRIFQAFSFFLVMLTIIDIIVIALIYLEYNILRKEPRFKPAK